MKNAKWVIPGVIFLGIAALFVGGVAFIFFQFNQYRATAAQLPPETQLSQVSIANPADGTQFSLNESVAIKVTAIGPTPYLSMELWVDGPLASVQSSSGVGKTPFTASFGWFPDAPGAHSIVARALTVENEAINSIPVIVLVAPAADGSVGAELGQKPSDGENGGAAGTYPTLTGGPAAPSAPSGDSTQGDAEEWSGSPNDWVNSLSNDLPPQAPELNATALQCAAELSFSDLSNNEEGFKLFRYEAPSSAWVEVTTLASQSQNDWLSYTDSNVSGGLQYYVAAFNSHGVSASNVVIVNVDPANCDQDSQAADLPALTIKMTDFVVEGASDQAYCYRSINGGAWNRWPAIGFLNQEADQPVSQGALGQIVLTDLEGNPQMTTLDLQLECWHWLGDQLEFLGDFEIENLGPDNTGLFPVDGDKLNMVIDVGLLGKLEEIEFYPLNGDGFDGFYDVNDFDHGALINSFQIMSQMPYVMPYVTYNADLCQSHLPPDAQNLVGKLLFCFPYPGFDAGDDAANPQPYLVWDFSKVCHAGYGYEDTGGPCKPYEAWLSLAADDGGKIGFNIYDNSNVGVTTWVVETPHLRNFVIPPNACTGGRSFFVQMWYQLPGGVKVFGPTSQDATINCPKPLGDQIFVDVTFTSINLSNVDDGDSGTQTVEVYGFFRVDAPSSELGPNNYLNIATWDEQDGDCPDDTGFFSTQQVINGYYSGCPEVLKNGSKNVADMYLCKASNHTSCVTHHSPNHSSHDLYDQNNNTLRVDVSHGDGINIYVEIYDWDDASGNDQVCKGFVQIAPKGLYEWAGLVNQSFGMLSFETVDDNADCTISGVLNGGSK